MLPALLVFISSLLTPHSSLFAADGPRLICGALSIASTTATWTPEDGCDAVDLYTGVGDDWQSFRSPAVSVALSVSNSARYDLFFYRSGNVIALQKGPAWASGSSRGTGAGTTELTLQNGVWVNAVDISGLCAAKLCRFAGTIQVDGGGAIALAQARFTGTFTGPRDVTIPDANSVTVQPSTATSQQFLTHIDASGVQQKAQPQNVTGNAATATALAANGANCSSGNVPLGVDAAGAAEGCFDVVTPAELQANAALYCADAGANDTYTCSLTPALTAYTDGMAVVFRPNTDNTGAATININSLGVKNIVAADNSTLADNALLAGRRYTLYYDGTSFRMHQDTGGGGGGSGTVNNGAAGKLAYYPSTGTTVDDATSAEQCDANTLGVGGCSASGTRTEIAPGQVNVYQADGTRAIKVVRGTDTSPTGAALDIRNAAENASAYTVDVTGKWTVGTLGAVGVGVGSDATGDIYYRNSSGFLARLGIGAAGGELRVASGLPAWQARKFTVQVPVFGAATTVTTGNGKKYFFIPAEFNNKVLVGVSAHVVTVSSSGAVTVSLTRCATVATGNQCSGTTAAMLSTALTIDANENKSATAAAAAVIDTAADDVTTDQAIRINVDTAGTGAAGLTVVLEFQ